jgi:hypothetical protein
MQSTDDDQIDIDATAEQIAELRRLGIPEADLQGLSSTDAEEWIDELRSERIDANRVDRT